MKDAIVFVGTMHGEKGDGICLIGLWVVGDDCGDGGHHYGVVVVMVVGIVLERCLKMVGF